MDISEKVGLAAELACLLEASAEKPGNVTPAHDFDDMKYTDFLISAAAAGRAFRNSVNSSVGEIILNAVKDITRLINVNTSLGIILLLAPLAKGLLNSNKDLRENVKTVLKNLTIKDAGLAYEAIRMANPGGMGRVQDHDISDTDVNITLLAAMELAKERDSIAGEYATGYEITLDIGLPALESTLAKGIHILEAVTQTYLIILSEKPDSLIARKNGMDKAREITRIATGVIKSGGIFSKKGLREIRGLDSLLRGGTEKSSRLNPGTTADLTAAVLFVYLMKNDLKIISVKTD